MSSDYFSPRSCCELKKDEAGRHAKSLESYRDDPAYVLLGQPGSGKTTAFKKEAEQPGCEYITARDFIALNREEWRDKTLFIDGLDEVRAIRKDDLIAFDEIRAKLDQLKPPRFRIACREADWDVTDDRERLAEVFPGRDVKELFLIDLEEKEIEQILINGYQMSPQEASLFLQKVEQDELTALIKNPHILDMLVLVAKKGDWPKTKLEVFQLACKKLLLAEWNRVHNKADISQTPDSEELMRAAGSLCATLLLAGKEAFAELRADADEDHPSIGELDIDDTGLLPRVARAKLFVKHSEYIECSHRTYAEYLSAYYLSWKIEQGLPVGRVLALLERGGEVILKLRGVLAWLATLHSQERSRLMRHDPLAVALYGDVSLFGKEQRLALLDELGRQAEEKGGPGIGYWNTRSFGGLCQADMEQEFRSIIQSTDHGDAQQQWRLFYVLKAMFHGEALPNLSDALAALIRSPEAQEENRRAALAILIRFDDGGILQAILQDIHRNIIIDSKDDLLAMLLNHLYPERVAPSELFDYLHSPKAPNHIGGYWSFWNIALEEKSDDEQAHDLLDALVSKQIVAENFSPLSDLSVKNMIGKLLARGLAKFGEVIEVENLSNWLALAVNECGFMRLDRTENSKFIHSWIEQRPEIQKKLVEHYLEKCIGSEGFDWRRSKTARWLLDGDFNLFEDYGPWCLNKARESSNEKMAERLFVESVRTLYGGKENVGLSLDLIEETLEQDPRLKPHWEKLRFYQIVDRDYGAQDWKLMQEIKERRQQEEEEQRKYTQYIEKHLKDIKTGMAFPATFHILGGIYYGYFRDVVGESPRERLRNYFRDNPGLVGPILTSLQNFLYRKDLPKVEAIIKFNNEKVLLFHSLPCLAGMNELGQKGKQAILDLGEGNIKKALAFYFTYAGHRGDAPEWYKTLLKEKPDWVAEVYGKYGEAVLRTGKSPNMIYALAYEKDHAQIAREVAIPLLRSVPARITSKQLDPLHRLLNAALRYADENQLKEVIREKTRLNSMDLRQRANWLTVGFILGMKGFETLLKQFIDERKSRIDYLSGFLSDRIDRWSPVEKMSLSALALFIKLFGSHRAPYQLPSSGSIDNQEDELSELISQMIHRLQDVDIAPEAIKATKDLLNQPDLAEWHPSLRTALQAQRSSRFPPISLEQVRRTLKNGPPANVADLASLTCEPIRDLAEQIKNGNTNDYRQYWDRNKNKQVQDRLHEEDCRDRFLSDLKPRLARMKVDAQPEGRYASDTRADIKVSYRDRDSELSCNVPIEIKCNDSKDLWRGIRQQLMEKYAQEPEAEGYGIYLVFWFGSKSTWPHPKAGKRPETPEKLQELLEQSLDNEERKRISVCVVDCTGPG